MKTSVSVAGKRVTTHDVTSRKPTRLDIPIRELSGLDVVVLGFRANMLEMGEHGGVDTGTGLGSDFILLRWGERKAVVRGSELLRAWVATFAPKDAMRFPKGIKK